jgi:hypothetical protein
MYPNFRKICDLILIEVSNYLTVELIRIVRHALRDSVFQPALQIPYLQFFKFDRVIHFS